MLSQEHTPVVSAYATHGASTFGGGNVDRGEDVGLGASRQIQLSLRLNF